MGTRGRAEDRYPPQGLRPLWLPRGPLLVGTEPSVAFSLSTRLRLDDPPFALHCRTTSCCEHESHADGTRGRPDPDRRTTTGPDRHRRHQHRPCPHSAGRAVILCEKGHIAGEQSSRNWGRVRKNGRDPAKSRSSRKAAHLGCFNLASDIMHILHNSANRRRTPMIMHDHDRT
jgi:hypothetical protein